MVPAEGKPIAEVVEFGDLLSPGISEQSEGYLQRNEKQISTVYEALEDGYNVAIGIPTHAQVHDLALPLGQLCMGLKMKYGYD
jgi:predicted SpoU family rRNA methylase